MRLLSLVNIIILFVCSLVKVHSEQIYPHVSFKDSTLLNHSYVNIEEVGHYPNGSDSVRCRTDLQSCCAGDNRFHRGDWYFPNGTRLPFGSNSADILQARGVKVIDLRRKTATSPAGIYRCDVSTQAVHNNSDKSVRESVYVGLYYTNDRGNMNTIIILCNAFAIIFRKCCNYIRRYDIDSKFG